MYNGTIMEISWVYMIEFTTNDIWSPWSSLDHEWDLSFFVAVNPCEWWSSADSQLVDYDRPRPPQQTKKSKPQ
jgi:hypothetical protein